jgi:hypothetical protein
MAENKQKKNQTKKPKPASNKKTTAPKSKKPTVTKTRKTTKTKTTKRSGGSDNTYGLFVPMSDISNTSGLNLNKQFKYAEVSRVGKEVQSNFGL